MATVKKANTAPTHPSVWVGLALAVVGLLVAMYAYTGTRVYDVTFAFVALAGALLALAGILAAAWGRSIMAARATRSRRGLIQEQTLKMGQPARASDALAEVVTSSDAPTVAAPPEKKRFGFGAKRAKAEKPAPAKEGGVFAFKRRDAAPSGSGAPRDDPRDPEVAASLAPAMESVEVRLAPTAAPPEPQPEPASAPQRLTLKCPRCAASFTAEGVRPFTATCDACGFSATV